MQPSSDFAVRDSSKSETLVFDSGRFPLWFRIPALVFGIFALWLGLDLAAGLFGLSLGYHFSKGSGSPVLASLACFAIGALWVFVWFAQLRLLFDTTRQELIVRTRGFFRSHDRRIALAGCGEILIRQVRTGRAGSTWRVSAKFADGRSEYVSDIATGIESLAKSLETVALLPVKMQADGGRAG